MNKSRQTEPTSSTTAYILYYLTVLLFVMASFAAGWRLWGFNYGAFLTPTAGILFLVIALVFPLIFDKLRTIRLNTPFWPVALLLAAIFTLLFVLIRTQTHFLGDGYTCLSLLEVDDPLLKHRELGESYIHLWIKDLVGSGKAAALGSFRVVSIGSGVLTTILTLWAGMKLFGRNHRALLFALIVMSGGYALLFFGYVENYSLFMFAVIATMLSGILATRGLLPKWLPIIAALTATLMHTIGAVLIPAALFVALKEAPIGRFFAHSRTRLATLVVALVATGVIAMVGLYQSNQFIRFSFLTLSSNDYTVGGYTLFAFEHLIDIANLLFLLVPSLLLLIWLMAGLGQRQLKSSFTYQFLGLAFLMMLAAVFAFDPKLGMPRDWDLFSLVGVPVVISAALISTEMKVAARPTIITMILILNLGVLFSRLAIINDGRSAITQFSSYLELDIGKSRPGSYILFKYFLENGDNTAADSLHNLWRDRYPEMYIMDTVNVDMKQGDFAAAAEKLERILAMTPTNHDALSNLGTCYTYLRQYDTALVLLNLAVGHNPYNISAWTNLGTIFFKQEDFERAEESWLKAYEMDSLSFTAPANLAMLYRQTGKRDQCLAFLRKAASTRDAPPAVYAKMAEFFLDEDNFDRAAALYRFGMQRGLDSAVVNKARTNYPAVDSIMSGS